MEPREPLRPGGRSARIQDSVHRAVRALLGEADRGDVTIPLIAQRAGVTPSTIYRRWGDLAALLADVAAARLRPDGPPADTGDLRGDLEAWAEQLAEELASDAGRAIVRDLLAGGGEGTVCGRCAAYTRAQIEVMLTRASARGEAGPSADRVLDRVVAPIYYRLIFTLPPISGEQAVALIAACFDADSDADAALGGERREGRPR
ncbi:TetR/AcrR family transcriptional regulator [Rhodospirillum rubrum]|nr:TetR/AcrR family transcriptional regulator [Rhodospirillum rubrum]AEO49713.1 TetR family transcriptional regulator [Rhodospirillum rubrum F11]